MKRIPWYTYLIVYRPRRVLDNLARIRTSALVRRAPNLWQVCQGVMRMWHRLLFRSNTVGLCTDAAVRPGWRARLLRFRPLRFPFLLFEGSVVPLDLSGLVSSPERLRTHLLGTHHDGNQFVYDLQILSVYDGELETLRRQTLDVINNDTRRTRWLRDLCIYEGYHESLLVAVDAALAGEEALKPDELEDPDVSFLAYLEWCATRPETPRRSWRRRRAC